jgi:putative ABC transport system ATP-binding protein
MPLIQLNEVSKLYGFGDAATIALDEVSLTIEKGEFIAIMGPSGSGKTTLMNVIGLLDRPSSGTFKLSGRDVARLRPQKQARHRRDHVGFIFQSFNLLPRLNILENVALPLAYKGMLQRRRLKAASQMLEQVGLNDREYYLPSQLSGGQLQRASIARALVNNPSIIIADEPTGNLDSTATRVVMELLSEVHKMGNTVLMVTHNPALTRYASRVIYMRDGQVVYDQESAIGEIPEAMQRAMQGRKFMTKEDSELAGVSAMLQEMPSVEAPSRKSIRKKLKTPRLKKRGNKK